MNKQQVDPLVTEAIQKAVEIEGWKIWGEEPPQPLPDYKPIPEDQKPYTTKWGFLSEIKSILP